MKLDKLKEYFTYKTLKSWIFLVLLTRHRCSGKHVLRLGAILADSFKFKKIEDTLSSALRDIVRENYRKKTLLLQYYDISTKTNPHLKVDLSNITPSQVMSFLCDDLLAQNANLLIYLMDEDTTGRSATLTNYLIRLANTIGLPIIAWLRDDNSGLAQTSSNSIVAQLTPTVFHQCEAMLSILRYYNWSAFSIVTGQLAGYNYFINNLVSEVEKEGSSFSILSVSKLMSLETIAIERELAKIVDAESRVVLFYGSRNEAVAMFEVAEKMNLLTTEFMWIVSKSVPQEPNGVYRRLPPGILGLDFPVKAPDTQQDQITRAVKLWFQAQEALLNNTPEQLRAEILLPNQSCVHMTNDLYWRQGQQLYDYIISQKVPMRMPQRIFNQDGTLAYIELKILNMLPNHRWKEKGTWESRLDKREVTIDDIYWPGNAPTPPSGRPAKYRLEVVTLEEEPYVKYSDPDPVTGLCPPMSYKCRMKPENITRRVNDTTNPELFQCASGLCMDLLRYLEDMIGFEVDLFQVEDGKWGAYDPEIGDWNGLVRAVRDEKADLVITSLKSTPGRNTQIHFSVPFLETGITIIVAVREGALTPTAFLKPFDLICWIFILIMCIQVLAVAVFLFEWLSPLGFNLQRLPVNRGSEPYDLPSWCLILIFSVHICGAAIFIFEWLSPNGLDRGVKPLTEHRFSLFRSFWLIWAMLFGAAVNVDNPRGVSSRFLANIWALFAVVFTASYTANLATFMITKDNYDRLTGIEDPQLQRPNDSKPRYKFATIPDGSTETNIKTNYPEMYRYMRQYSTPNVAEGVKAVLDGELNAFIYDASVLEFKASQDKECELKTVGKWSALAGYGIGFPKNSKWLPIFNEKLLMLQHDGTLERLQKFWLAGACKPNSDEETKSRSIPLEIPNFTSAFILLAFGMLLGGILLLLEHVYFKFFRAKLRKLDKCGCCGLISLSMGKSLTFEQSVREAIEMQKHHKCKNPVCETQSWKIKHELDLALIKIDRLKKQLGENGIAADDKAVWRDTRAARATQSQYVPSPHYARLRRGDTPKTNPNFNPSSSTTQPAIGWKSDLSRANDMARTSIDIKPVAGQSVSSTWNTSRPRNESSGMTPSGMMTSSGGIWHSPMSRAPAQQRQSWHAAAANQSSQDSYQTSSVTDSWSNTPPHHHNNQSYRQQPPQQYSSQQPYNQTYNQPHYVNVADHSHRSTLPPQPPTLSGVTKYTAYQDSGYYDTIQTTATLSTPCKRHHPTMPTQYALSRSKSLPGSPIRRGGPVQQVRGGDVINYGGGDVINYGGGSGGSGASEHGTITRTISFPDSPGKQRRRMYHDRIHNSRCNKSDPFIFEKETVL